jgi:hypothetical protein
MKIVVIGGTGLIGSKTVAILRQRGHEVVAASPNTGVNTITGEGLKEAMTDAQVVIDLANSPYKETDRSCDGRHGLEFDGKAELGEAFDEAARLRVGPPTNEVSGSEIFIERAVFEHVIDGREDGGRDSADRFLRSAPTAQSHELRVQVGGFGARGRPSALNEHGLEPGGSPAQARRPALAGTFVIARTQASPGAQITPVASIATCVQPFTSSHSPNSIRLAVVVANVRTERDTSPPSTMRTHATTVSLCTSRPAQRGYITSMTSSPVASPAWGTSIGNSIKRAPDREGHWHNQGCSKYPQLIPGFRTP